MLLKKKVFPTSPKVSKPYTGAWRDNFPWQPEMKHYEIVDTEEKLKRLREKLLVIPEFAFDTETNTLRVYGPNKDFKLVGISISWGENDNYYIPVGHIREEDINNQLPIDMTVEYLKEPFERKDLYLIAQHAKYDAHVFRRIGINIQTKDIFDTMIASFLCDENLSKGLKEQSMYRMGLNQTHFKEATATVPNEVKKQFGFKSNSKVTFDLVKISDAAPYALADSFNTYMLSLGFRKELEDEKMDKIYWNMYAPFIYTLLEMEEKGVTVDMPELEEMGVEMQKDLEDLTYKIYELAGCEFNINSSQQKAELLFGYKKDNKPFTQTDYEKLPKIAKEVIEKAKHKSITVAKANEELAKRNIWIDPNTGKMWKTPKSEVDFGDKSFKFKVLATTESGSPSTDSDTIWRLSNLTFKNKRKQQGADMCKYLLQYSELNKLKTAFVDGLKEQVYDDGKAHPSFNIGGASSGRLSCQSPNLNFVGRQF